MNQAPVRQLSAIMFADIVGFTAMMQHSEADAVASRNRFRQVLADLLPRHGGTAVQHYGDGTLTTFPSAVEATSCALRIQQSLTAEPRVPLRIGLHVGDVVRDEEGVYGNGVNLAARVQALAVAGSVLVTELYREAIKIDPGLALAHAGIASSYVFLGAVGRIPSTVAYGEAQSAATHALSLESDSCEAEVALAVTALFYEWNRDRADGHFQRALELGPGSATVHHYRGMYYSVLRRHSLAIAAMQTAASLDPLSAPINNDLARALLPSGQPEEALIQVERTLELAPSFRSAFETKAMIHWVLNDVTSAIDAIQAYRSLSPSPYAGAAMLGYLLARSGDVSAAQVQHQLLEERERVEPGTSLDLDFAMSYLGMRQHGQALSRLEKAVDSRTAAVIFGLSIPLWDELADNARFKALRERIGLWD